MPSKKEQAAVRQLMKRRIMQNSLFHLQSGGLDSRTVFLLQKRGLLRDARRTPGRPDLAELIANPHHPDRLSSDWGPLIFARGDGKTLAVMLVPDLLIDNDAALRRAVLGYLEQGRPVFNPRTWKTIEESRGKLTGSGDWLSAAVSIHDSVTVDFFFNLAGVRQSHVHGYADGLDQFGPKVLCPTLAAIESASPPVLSPREQKEQIEQAISQYVEQSDTLIKAVDACYLKYGYLPLSTTLSMSRLVGEWLQRRGPVNDAWNALWEWAHTFDPVRSYHVCSVFLNNSGLVPPSAAQTLWSEIARVLEYSSGQPRDSSCTSAWRLRCELARHYCQHLECLLPGQDGEKIAAFAWWLTQHVASALKCDAGKSQDLYENAVRHYEHSSAAAREAGHPATKGSPLRLGTLFLSSVWSASLECQVGQNAGVLFPETMRDSDRTIITQRLCESAVLGFPRVPRDGVEVYAFDRGVVESAKKWAEVACGDDDRTRLEALIALGTATMPPSAILDLTARLPEYAPAVQLLIARLLFIEAYLDELPADLLWSSLQSPEWRRKIFGESTPEAMAMLCSVMIEVQVKTDGKWKTRLPHFLASAYEDRSASEERRKSLLACVITACLSTNTISAIERVLHGPSPVSNFLREEIKGYRARLESFNQAPYPWIPARIRPVLAVLSTVV